MALSGSVKTTAYDGRYYQVDWTATQSIATNKSTINWTLKAMTEGWWAERTLIVSIGGTAVYSKTSRVERWDGVITSGATTISHNSAGAASFTISIQAAVYGSSINCTGSSTFTLDTIPRKAELKSYPAAWTDEQSPKITYSNPAGTAVTSLQACIAWDKSTVVVAYRDIPKTGTLEYTFTLTAAEKQALQEGVNNGSTSRGVMFFVKTVIGSNNPEYSYNDASKSTLTIAACAPTLTPSVRDTNSNTIILTGSDQTIVKHRSRVEAATGAVAKKHARITSQAVTCGSDTFYTSPAIIENPQSGLFNFVATDSRGQTVTDTKLLTPSAMTFIEYIELTCSQRVSISIDDDAGETSAMANLTISGNYFNGSFGVESNTLTLWYRYKKTTDPDWSTMEQDGWQLVDDTISKSNGTYTVTIPVAGLSQTEQYVFQSMAEDRLGNVTTTEYKVKTQPVFDWSETDFNFNVPVSIKGKNIIDIIYPVGSIHIRYDHIDPKTLFGGTWLRITENFLWATSAGGNIGRTGGESTHILTIDEMPSHAHGAVYSSYTDASVTKEYAWYLDSGNKLGYAPIAAGGGKAHNNMPPYIQVSVWRRTA